MSVMITVTYGSCIDWDIEFFDEDGNPEDISGDEFSVLMSKPAILAEAIFTKTDPVNGKLHLFLSAEHSRQLGIGNVNWFRLRRTMPGGCDDNTTPIWVHVQ